MGGKGGEGEGVGEGRGERARELGRGGGELFSQFYSYPPKSQIILDNPLMVDIK